jgi:anti-sigma regulatory factor (Ser/Thr protein kinase)
MKLDEHQEKLNSPFDNTKSFGISINGKAFDILSNKLYSRKVEAIIREVASNAKDAQQQLDPNTPIKINLPTVDNPIFWVEDRGTGIDPERFSEVCTYFASDKTKSNQLIGGFGLGFKVPFCLVNNFTVENRYNGKMYTYSCFKAGSGEPDYSLISEEKTDKTNGVKISMIVPQQNISEFIPNAIKIFKWWDVKPEFIGVNPFNNFNNDIIDFNFKDFYLINHSNITYNSCICIIGEIPYEVNFDEIPFQDDILNFFRYDLTKKLAIKFDIGELQVSPSRENLDFDVRNISEFSTHNVLQNRLKQIHQKIIDSAELLVDNCSTVYDYLKLTDSYYKESILLKILWDKNHFYIKNKFEELSGFNTIKISNNLTHWELIEVNYKKYESNKFYHAKANQKFVVFDLGRNPNKKQIYNRIGDYVGIVLKKGEYKNKSLYELALRELNQFKEKLIGWTFKQAKSFSEEKNEKLISPSIVVNKLSSIGCFYKMYSLEEQEEYNVWITERNELTINDRTLSPLNLTKLMRLNLINKNDLFINETMYKKLSKQFKFTVMNDKLIEQLKEKITDELLEKHNKSLNYNQFYSIFSLGSYEIEEFEQNFKDVNCWQDIFKNKQQNSLTIDEQSTIELLQYFSLIDIKTDECYKNQCLKLIDDYPLVNILLSKWGQIIVDNKKLRDLKEYFGD